MSKLTESYLETTMEDDNGRANLLAEWATPPKEAE